MLTNPEVRCLPEVNLARLRGGFLIGHHAARAFRRSNSMGQRLSSAVCRRRRFHQPSMKSKIASSASPRVLNRLVTSNLHSNGALKLSHIAFS